MTQAEQAMLITPKLGEIRNGRNLGYKYTGRFIWAACIHCDKQRWVPFLHGEPKTIRCRSCALEGNKNRWLCGRYKGCDGYIRVYLEPNDFFRLMANTRGYVKEHRLVVAKALGRCLHPWEIVHHKKGFAKDDNRYPETLQLVMEGQHNQITILGNRIKYLEQRVTILEAENVVLESELNSIGKEEAWKSKCTLKTSRT